MARVIFWDVDTQYDFMHADGKLYVPEAERVTTNLQRLTDYAHGHGIRIVASADDHVMGHPEISDKPDWQSTFPAHCMRGTPGQKKIPETALRDPLVIEPARTDAKALADRLRAHQGDVLLNKHRFDVFTNEEAPLARLFRTCRPVLVVTASAPGFMEMAVRNGVRHRALSVVNGSFSERFANLVRACAKECVRLDVPLGCAVEPDMLRDTLRRTPVDAVTLVHSETSTGVLQDVEALAGVVREFDDVLLLVDAVTSLAGSPVETDRWRGGLDFVLTGSQKALALPPGLAFGAASERMLERARTLPARGLYFDLVSFLEATTKHQPTNTPAVSLLFALEAQLGRIEREGGPEGRWRRHDAMRRRVEEWSEQHGIAYLPREGRRSWTVSCLKVPEGKSAKQIVGAAKQAGWAIGSGDGPLKEAPHRIGR